MATVGHGLDQTQRWMQAVITHPGGVVTGIESEEAKRFLDVGVSTVERVVSRSRSLSALDRLELYANAYFARLLECLRSEFPLLRRAVGEEIFDEIAIGYLQSYPPRNYSLNRLGDHVACYLAETRPAGDLKGDDDRWADLCVDLAALEWAVGEVFDGPGCEGERLLDAEQLWAVPAARQPAVVLDSVPSLRLLASRYPLRDYYAALRDGRDVAPPAPRESFLALTRRNYVVQLHELTHGQYVLLAALGEGVCLGQAVERTAAVVDSWSEAFAPRLAEWFREWAEAGFFRTVIDPGSTRPDSRFLV